MKRKGSRVLSCVLASGFMVLLHAATVGATESIMPLSELPVTGDTTNPWPLILLAVAAAALMTVVLVTRKKK